MKRKKNTSTDSRHALSRCHQLAERTVFDLKLAHDAAVACGLPFVSLSKLKRARREMSDLLRE